MENDDKKKKKKDTKKKKVDPLEDLMFDATVPTPSPKTPVPVSIPPPSPIATPSRSIEDLLKMENASTTSGVNDVQLEEEKKKLEERKNQLILYKKELQEVRGKTVDEYMDTKCKDLIDKGMIMLDSIQREIEENPRGRDVETAAAMMSAINGIIDNLNKQKVYRQKMALEERKLELKQQTLASGNITANQTNNYILAGNHKDLLDMIRGDKPFPGQELKEAEIIKDPIVKQDEDTEE